MNECGVEVDWSHVQMVGHEEKIDNPRILKHIYESSIDECRIFEWPKKAWVVDMNNALRNNDS